VASRPVRAPRAPVDDAQGGFSVIEVMVGLGIFAVLAIGFASTMATSLSAQVRSRQRATANQLATQQVEQARTLAYDDVGTVGGNPVGTLQPSSTVAVGTATYEVRTAVELVADRVDTAFATQADYKRLTVTVTLPGRSTTLARLRTLIAPPTQPSLTKAIVQAEVVDSQDSNAGVAGVTVQLSGPSGLRTGVTDQRGYVIFPALPPTEAGETYAIAATSVPAPWQLFDADQVAEEVAGPALATQTKVLRLRLSRPVPVHLELRDTNGAAFATPSNVTVTSSRGPATSYSTTTGIVGPIDLWSGVTYTVAASSVAQPSDTTARFSTPVTLVPATTGTTTGTLTMVDNATTPMTIQVRRSNGTGIADVAVKISGGPKDVLLTGTTGPGGDLVVPLPAGSGYTITIDAQSGWRAATATGGTAAPVRLTMVAAS
jgi:type II secretory pathway pseudopilin PulG